MNVIFWTTTLVLANAVSAFRQETAASTATLLPQLVAEAQANNPQISAADHEAQAARQMAPQVTTLPDPKLMYQQCRKSEAFAWYTDSDFAYIGVGVSQELSYPGKLRLRGQPRRSSQSPGLALALCA